MRRFAFTTCQSALTKIQRSSWKPKYAMTRADRTVRMLLKMLEKRF
jgi:hypothetical protein